MNTKMMDTDPNPLPQKDELQWTGWIRMAGTANANVIWTLPASEPAATAAAAASATPATAPCCRCCHASPSFRI